MNNNEQSAVASPLIPISAKPSIDDANVTSATDLPASTDPTTAGTCPAGTADPTVDTSIVHQPVPEVHHHAIDPSSVENAAVVVDTHVVVPTPETPPIVATTLTATATIEDVVGTIGDTKDATLLINAPNSKKRPPSVKQSSSGIRGGTRVSKKARLSSSKKYSSLPWDMPVKAKDIRPAVQALPDDQLLLWWYEIEAERRRRSEARTLDEQKAKKANKQQALNQSMSTEPSQVDPSKMPTGLDAAAAPNDLQGNLSTAANGTSTTGGETIPVATEGNAVYDPTHHPMVAAAAVGAADDKTSTMTTEVKRTGPQSTYPGKKVTKNELTWNHRFQELVDFRIKHGHCDVPDEGYSKLSKWVQTQRRAFKERQKAEHANAINAPGDAADAADAAAAAAANTTGTAATAGGTAENAVAALPTPKTKTSSMTDERLYKLQNLGFKFEIKNDWYKRYQQLLEFREKHGHTRVPQHYRELDNLGMWVKGQRAAMRHIRSGAAVKTSNHHKLDDERIGLLNEIGFEWVVKRGGQRGTMSNPPPPPNQQHHHHNIALLRQPPAHPHQIHVGIDEYRPENQQNI